ncbi:4-hydroxythreonine-4-phosphate dehydrogenase [Candidatus Vecturithrix granuli]|uniref:4-hydroxythreonine-4-phosphate dehydrogenase n=1 Tax=Vecturithrix granuli TaxID=1499967 RepID=A0A081BU98_VECG1|nr:4-hydroxythreonine-4-phosphate dehydrogenase [Candidatus Vecturithrix granuli]
MKQQRPLLGISVGDPAGVGPEITAKALVLPEIYEICRPLAVAETEMMRAAVKFSGLTLNIHPVNSPQEGRYEVGTLDVLDLKNIDGAAIVYQQISTECGRASFEYVKKVIELALAKEIDATVTGPINKEAINRAGFHYAGHTEIYAKLTNTKDYAMMLMHEQFRVIHVSTHVALREACNRVKKERVHRVIRLAHDTLRSLGIAAPRIAVAGLNPHAGENGLFGREEIDEIIPAIQQALQEGLTVEGPIPADTVFSKMAGGQYDIVVVMYHDQGHIPTKLKGFQYDQKTDTWGSISGVNITCGLPIIRVSVDHGTAFDKSGEGRANPESMIQAIEIAAQLASTSKKFS